MIKLIYLGLGIVNDLFVTAYYLCIGRHLPLLASLLSMIITLLGFFIIGKALVSMDWLGIVFYAMGSGIGCFIITHYSKKTKKK